MPALFPRASIRGGMHRLDPQEISTRMVELRNLRKLHAAQSVRIGLLEEQAALLKTENKLLHEANAILTATVDDFKLQLEELKTMVFGRKRKNNDHDIDDTPPAQRVPRSADSYKRSLPKETDVTETKDHTIDTCTHCHGAFSERDSVTYFEEDIPLPQKRAVIKHVVEKGYCTACKRWSAGTPLLAATVVLGGNVKRYVTYLSVCARQSYAQIQDVLKQTYDFDISQGEIAKILDKEGNRMRPEYERLKARIRGEPSVHLDETGWDLLVGDGYRRYAWTMVGGESADAVFMLGKTRGKGNATSLLGDSDATLVSDDYAAYRDRDKHQLCCAHILHKLRDLALSSELSGSGHDRCVEAYKTFAVIYADIEQARMSKTPASRYDALLGRLHAFSTADPADCAKLARIRKQVADRAENYLTCLLHPCATDNNTAERSLRHLVLKRKISFGSFSEKTADTLAILLSVLMSFKQRGTLRNYLVGV
jgi:transposase